MILRREGDGGEGGGLVDEVAVAQFIAWKDKAETAEERRRKKALKEQKDALFAALSARCRARAALLDHSRSNGEEAGEAERAFEAAYGELRRWVDVASAEHVEVYAQHERLRGRPGNAVKVLNKALADKDKLADRELLALKEEVLRELGWRHWADLQRAASQQAFPADFATL